MEIEQCRYGEALETNKSIHGDTMEINKRCQGNTVETNNRRQGDNVDINIIMSPTMLRNTIDINRIVKETNYIP